MREDRPRIYMRQGADDVVRGEEWRAAFRTEALGRLQDQVMYSHQQ